MAQFYSDNFKDVLAAPPRAAAGLWSGEEYTAGSPRRLISRASTRPSILYETGLRRGHLLREETAEDADPTTQS